MRSLPRSISPAVFLGLAALWHVEPARAQEPASRGEDVICEVEGSTPIIRLSPELALVRKGDVVCELDSSNLRNTLLNQKIKVQAAKAAYENAKLVREIAEIAIKEHQAIIEQRVEKVNGDIQIAESQRRLAEKRIKRVKEDPSTDELTIQGHELDLTRARLDLSQAQSRKTILQAFTTERERRELRVNAEKARLDEQAKQDTLSLEEDRADKYAKHIAACKLVAPIDGVVVYRNDKRRIEEGDSVRERQIILRVQE